MTKIMGQAVATADQMAAYLLSKNSSPQINMPVKQFCQLFLDMGAKEGVRGDGLFAQSCKETGNFKFPGTVSPDQNNYAGIGTLDANTKGAYFACEADGILAQAQHAKGYATRDDLCEACIDPRYSLLWRYGKVGTAEHWEQLGGSWAVPGYDTNKYKSLEEANANEDSYGYQVINILNRILAVEIKEETKKEEATMGNSPLVDYVCISPNSTNPRQNKIKKITIHHMAGNLSVETCGNVFLPKEREASANYGIGSDGRVGMYVEEKNRAWTSGSRDNDNQAVTIEVANDEIGGNWHVSDKALAKLILLCADICKRNGIKKLNYTGNKNGNLTMHKWFQATTCPGPHLESKFPYIAAEVNKLLVKVYYKVQVGAFALKKNAENLVAELKKKGFDAIIVKKLLWYKVQVGAYEVKANAEAMKKRLESLGYKPFIAEEK